MDKNNPTAWYHRGVLYISKNDLTKGIEDLSEAIDIAPDTARFYDARGYVYITQNDYSKAMEDYETAVEKRS